MRPGHFQKFDKGAGHRAKGEIGDCTVRAFATAACLSWDAAWKRLFAFQGLTRTCGFDLGRMLDALPAGLATPMAFPATKGKPRVTARTFAERHPRGRFILRLAHHVVAVVDGVILDTWDPSHKCVYKAWQLSDAWVRDERVAHVGSP